LYCITGGEIHKATNRVSYSYTITSFIQVNLGETVTHQFLPPLVLEQNLLDKWHKFFKLWAGCPFCHPNNNATAKNEISSYTIHVVGIVLFSLFFAVTKSPVL